MTAISLENRAAAASASMPPTAHTLFSSNSSNTLGTFLTSNLEDDEDSEKTFVHTFKDIPSALQFEDFFIKIRTDTILRMEAEKYVDRYPESLFAVDSFGFTAVQYTERNRNVPLCLFLMEKRYAARMKKSQIKNAALTH